MLTRKQKYKLGLFVVSGIGLFVAFLLVLAGGKIFERRFPAYTTFSESVQGLEIGSPVKFQGVPVGQVSNIQITPDKTGDSAISSGPMSPEELLIRVDMTFNPESIRFETVKEVELFFRKQVEKGARCRLELAGITGARYLDIGYFDAPGTPPIPPIADPYSIYIPSSQSLYRSVTSNVSYTLAKLSSIPFDKIGNDLAELVATTKSLAQRDEPGDILASTKVTMANMQELTGRLNRNLDDSRLDSILKDLQVTLADYRELSKRLGGEVEKAKLGELSSDARTTLSKADALITRLDGSIGQADTLFTGASEAVVKFKDSAERFNTAMAAFKQTAMHVDKAMDDAELSATTQSAREALAEAERAFRSVRSMRSEISDTMRRLQDTLDSMKALSEYLNEDPGSLLRGKQKSPATIGRE